MPTRDMHFRARVNTGDLELQRLVARAEALMNVLNEIPLPPGVRASFDRLNILRAVRGTTGIDGTEVSEEEVSEILATPDAPVLGAARARDEAEVRNANRVML